MIETTVMSMSDVLFVEWMLTIPEQVARQVQYEMYRRARYEEWVKQGLLTRRQYRKLVGRWITMVGPS